MRRNHIFRAGMSPLTTYYTNGDVITGYTTVTYTPEQGSLFEVMCNNGKVANVNSLYAAWYLCRKGKLPENFADISKETALLMYSEDYDYWDFPESAQFAKVFLVEDHMGEYDYCAYFFTEYGASVTTFDNLEEALEWCTDAEEAIANAVFQEEGADV